jgi:hypothetical protein
MPQCSYCRKEIGIENDYCPYCGSKIFPPPIHHSNGPIDEEELKTFIGKNADYYLRKFRKFQYAGKDQFAVTWHWPAFWLGSVWMLYRKMYLWALIAFIIALTPIAFPVTMIGWAVTANYLYYLHIRKKIMDYQPSLTGDTKVISLYELGGVNRWVWFGGILFILILMVLTGVGLLLLLHLFKYKLAPLPDFLEV